MIMEMKQPQMERTKEAILLIIKESISMMTQGKSSKTPIQVLTLSSEICVKGCINSLPKGRNWTKN